MSYTATSIFGKQLEKALEPWLDNNGDLARVCDAWGKPIEPLMELIAEVGSDGEPGFVPPWGTLLDPDRCPYRQLPYLAQWVGVEIPKTASEAEARKLIKEQSAATRGTRAAVEVAIRKSLTGNKEFQIVERRAANGEEAAYHFQILIYNAGELPSEATLKANVEAVKPGGVFFTVVIGGLTYAIAEAAHTLYSESEAVHATYADLEANPSK